MFETYRNCVIELQDLIGFPCLYTFSYVAYALLIRSLRLLNSIIMRDSMLATWETCGMMNKQFSLYTKHSRSVSTKIPRVSDKSVHIRFEDQTSNT